MNDKEIRRNEFIEKLNKYNPNIVLLGEYKNNKTKTLFKCLIHDTEWETTPSAIINAHLDCPKCRKPKKNQNSTKQEFINKLNNIYDNIEVLGEYINARTNIECKCIIHNYIWSPKPYNLLSGFGCPKCGREKAGKTRRTSDKLEKLIECNPNIDFLSIPQLTKDYVKCQCKECGNEWSTTYSNLTNPCNHTGCPRCSKSKGEKKIISILENKKVEYECQKTFKECKDIHVLPFDIYIPSKNTCIEYDGEHHYKVIPRSKDNSKNIQEFNTIQQHDRIKNDFCKNNHINLVRIPYYEYDNIENILLKII